MLRFCLLILIFSQSSWLFAQESSCGTIASPKQIQYMDSIHDLAKSARIMNSPVNVPVQFHILRRSNGTGGLDPARIPSLIDQVNNVYQGAGISFFQPNGTNFIDNDEWYNFESSEENALASSRDVPNVINIYIPGTVRSGSFNVCGYAYFPPSQDRLFVALGCADTEFSTTAHEIGHYLDLFHTHGKTNTGTTDELVQRINCDVLGDNLCDTEADPNLSGRVSGCSYTGTVTDSNGDLFKPDVRNIMSYAPRNCRTIFTNGQLNRMREALDFARTNLNVVYQGFNARFSSDIRSGCAPLTVQFIDRSAGAQNRKWEFINDGGNVITSSDENPLITFQNPGIYDVRLVTTNNNDEEKQILRNDYLVVNDIYENVVQDTIFNNVDGLTLPVNWEIVNFDQLETYARSDVSADASGGSLVLNNFTYEPQVFPAIDDVELSNYNIDEVKSFKLLFDYAYTFRAGNVSEGVFPIYDSLAIGYKVNCDDKFYEILKLGGDELKTAPATNNSFIPKATEWETLSYEIHKNDISSSVKVLIPVIRNIGRNGNNLYLDNFELVPDFTLDSLRFFRVSNQESSSISIRWQNPAINETGVKIERSTDGVNFNIIAELPKDANTFVDENLPEDASTIYYRAVNFNSQASSSYTPIIEVNRSITSIGLNPDIDNDIVLYPNPVNDDYVNLSGDCIKSQDIDDIKIYSTIGNLVGSYYFDELTIVNNALQIPIKGFNKGIYIIHLNGHNNCDNKLKLIVN